MMKPCGNTHLFKLESRHVLVRHAEHVVHRIHVRKVHFARVLRNGSGLHGSRFFLLLFLLLFYLLPVSLTEIEGSGRREDCGCGGKSNNEFLVYGSCLLNYKEYPKDSSNLRGVEHNVSGARNKENYVE